MATKKKKTDIEKVVIIPGTHLTVYKYPDGQTRLEWDDKQLLKEVTEAIASYEAKKNK